jgi:hypothetical protein
MRTTYHAKHGRFTSVGGAHTVTRDGQRFLMVRSLRPMKGAASREAGPAPTDAEVSQGVPVAADVAEAIGVAKAKAALASILMSSPGWIPLHECVPRK